MGTFVFFATFQILVYCYTIQYCGILLYPYIHSIQVNIEASFTFGGQAIRLILTPPFHEQIPLVTLARVRTSDDRH